jgi:hypothetical protein
MLDCTDVYIKDQGSGRMALFIALILGRQTKGRQALTYGSRVRIVELLSSSYYRH